MEKKSRLSDVTSDSLPSMDHQPAILSTRAGRLKETPFIRRCFLVAISITFTLWLFYLSLLSDYPPFDTTPSPPLDSLPQAQKNTTKVALEAHIMSKCPDAKACLEKLVVPAMADISDLVDFNLSYIGSIDSTSDSVSCMHGETECLGNMVLLCAAHIYPDPKLHLGFARCVISEYQEIPERGLFEGCALEHGIDFERVNNCISSENGDGHGIELLRESFEWTKENNVTRSCTVRLEGEVRCIRDGGKWKDCEGGSSVDDLVEDVQEAYKKANE